MLRLLCARSADSAAVLAFGFLGALGVALSAVDIAVHRLPDKLTLPAYPMLIPLLGIAAVAGHSGGALLRALPGGAAARRIGLRDSICFGPFMLGGALVAILVSGPFLWYCRGMRAAIDKAGRLVIPKALRDSLGLVPGEVEVTPDGAGLHIEPLANDYLTDEDGFLVIPAGAPVSDELVRELRDAGQR